MPSVVAYHRPQTIDEAAELLSDTSRRAIGGGTVTVPRSRVERAVGVELVDLQDLGLAGITVDADGRLRIGAMVRIGDLMAHPEVPSLLSELARRELPSTLRYQATVGGTVALADPDSILVAGLLVHDAVVELHDDDPRPLGRSIDECVGQRIVTAITIDPTGEGAVAATGRTPADEPIVAAVSRAADTGRRLALTGVASSPIEVDVDDPIAGLDPPEDFRGSSRYRRHLATVLADRVRADLEGTSR